LHIQEQIGEIESDAAITESEAATDDPVYNDEPVVDNLQQEMIADKPIVDESVQECEVIGDEPMVLINHYRYNAELEPEKYFYFMLLLFKPWRDSSTLMGDSPTYTEASNTCKDDLLEGLKYHNQLFVYKKLM